MFCVSCGSNVPNEARFCPSCGKQVPATSEPDNKAAPLTNDTKSVPSGISSAFSVEEAKPSINMQFREKLLQCYLDFSTSLELSDWLRKIGQDPVGTVEEKMVRIKQHTKYLSMSLEDFPEQTIFYLNPYNAATLSEICQDLGIDSDGPKNILIRRIYREIGYRESWLPTISDATPITKQTVIPFVKWYPILKSYNYEKDYYQDFMDEMLEIFGPDNVHEQLPVAHGTTLKIDFHIGHPQKGGTGVEFKVPKSNSELQRALGQMDQYASRYGSELIVVLIPDFLANAQVQQFLDELRSKRIDTVVKTKVL